MTGPLTPPQIKLFTAAVKVVKFVGPLPEALIVYVPFMAIHEVYLAVSLAGFTSATPFGAVVNTLRSLEPLTMVTFVEKVKLALAQGLIGDPEYA